MKETIKEPYIVAIDDDAGDFELVIWHQTKDEAVDEFNVLAAGNKYLDKQGRHVHVFKMIKTTGPDLDEEEFGEGETVYA